MADALIRVSPHGEMGSLFGVSCRRLQPYRRRYLRSLGAHTWKSESTCELSDLTPATVGWVAPLVCVADDHRLVDGGKSDLLPGSTLNFL